jgi:hypothetical protein
MSANLEVDEPAPDFGHAHLARLSLDDITLSPDLQNRVRMSDSTIKEWTEALEAGDTFPPVVVFRDVDKFWLADGFHRWHAHKEAGRGMIFAHVYEGGRDLAEDYSLGANYDNGIQRTNEDKRAAVLRAIKSPRHAFATDRSIANLCRVSHPMVARIRAAMAPPLLQVERSSIRNSADPAGSQEADDPQTAIDLGDEGEAATKLEGSDTKPSAPKTLDLSALHDRIIELESEVITLQFEGRRMQDIISADSTMRRLQDTELRLDNVLEEKAKLATELEKVRKQRDRLRKDLKTIKG